MNFRLPLFIFLFFSAFPFFSFAQQCGWSGYQVFVLDIRSETNNKAIEGLKVTLMDEEGNICGIGTKQTFKTTSLKNGVNLSTFGRIKKKIIAIKNAPLR
jgi:hypothetical protein